MAMYDFNALDISSITTSFLKDAASKRGADFDKAVRLYNENSFGLIDNFSEGIALTKEALKRQKVQTFVYKTRDDKTRKLKREVFAYGKVLFYKKVSSIEKDGFIRETGIETILRSDGKIVFDRRLSSIDRSDDNSKVEVILNREPVSRAGYPDSLYEFFKYQAEQCPDKLREIPDNVLLSSRRG